MGRYWLPESARGWLLKKLYEHIGKMGKSQAGERRYKYGGLSKYKIASNDKKGTQPLKIEFRSRNMAKISMLPKADYAVAKSLFNQAEAISASDPQSALALQREVISFLENQIKTRNKSIRVLKHMLSQRLTDARVN